MKDLARLLVGLGIGVLGWQAVTPAPVPLIAAAAVLAAGIGVGILDDLRSRVRPYDWRRDGA